MIGTDELGNRYYEASQNWIDQSRESELERRRIEGDSDDWRRNGRDRSELYRRRKLANALDIARKEEYELSQNAAQFLAAGRRRRLLARLGLAMVAAAALAGMFGSPRPRSGGVKRWQAEALSPVRPRAAGSWVPATRDHLPPAAG